MSRPLHNLVPPVTTHSGIIASRRGTATAVIIVASRMS